MAGQGCRLDKRLDAVVVKRLLMIAFHYPPIRGSSGVQRTLSFSRYLPRYGWMPTVLTVNKGAFPLVSSDQLDDIPPTVEVHRALALDATRHLPIGRWTPDPLRLPDRWASWYWTGTRLARRLVRNRHFDAIWSTYPTCTAHRIGLRVAASSGLPWVADFRDGMYDEWFPEDRARRQWHERIERETVSAAARVVLVTEGTKSLYAGRYPQQDGDKFVCIPNGYDEEIIGEVAGTVNRRDVPDRPIRILHSGILYSEERDPTALFEAVSRLKQAGALDASRVQIILRGSRHEDEYRPILEALNVADVVRLERGVGYRDAIREMFEVDGLLLLQGPSCNNQIPAKVYEYMRAGKPLFALTDERGDTARLLASVDYGSVVPMSDTAAIERGLDEFIDGIRLGRHRTPATEEVRRYSREYAARSLAELLDGVGAEAGGNGRAA